METPPEIDLNPPDVPATVRPGSRQTLEIVAITLLGALSFCGLMLMILSLIPRDGQVEFTFGLVGLGLILASLSSIAMIWFRDRRRSISGLLAVGILSWFMGANIMGVGGSFLLLPNNDYSVLENLGWTTFFCFAPGGLLALLGLGFYGYEFRRRRSLATGLDAANLLVEYVDLSRPDKVRRAEEYLAHITAILNQKRIPLQTGQAGDLSSKLTRWKRQVERLVERLEAFETNPIIQRDLQEVPRAIERLKADLDSETDPLLSQQLAETLRSYENQQDQLAALQRLMRRTDLEIDETLATIGTIYSQLHLLNAKEIDSTRADRLAANIDEEAARLGDLLSTLDEVYLEMKQQRN